MRVKRMGAGTAQAPARESAPTPARAAYITATLRRFLGSTSTEMRLPGW